MSQEVYREAALSASLDDEPMVKVGLSGEHLSLVLNVLIRAANAEQDRDRSQTLNALVDQIQELAVPLAYQMLVKQLVRRIREDHSDVMNVKLVTWSREAGIEIPEVLR